MRFFASIYILVFAALLFGTPSHAQSVELFGGYSFVRAPVTFTQTILCPVPGCPTGINTQNLNLKGWELGGAFKVFGPLALAADFGRTSGSFQGANMPGRISPFAHFLVGAAHESIDTSAGSLTFGPTQSAFATALGGGIDLKVLPLLSIRPIQIDYLLTHFNSSAQNQFRVSTGIVVHF